MPFTITKDKKILSKPSMKVFTWIFNSNKYEIIATPCFAVKFKRKHNALISLKNCTFVVYFPSVAEKDRPVPPDDALTCTEISV